MSIFNKYFADVASKPIVLSPEQEAEIKGLVDKALNEANKVWVGFASKAVIKNPFNFSQASQPEQTTQDQPEQPPPQQWGAELGTKAKAFCAKHEPITEINLSVFLC